MTRRGLFRTLFGGMLAAMGFRPRKTWMVPIFYKREISDQELLKFKLGLYTQFAGQWKWIDHQKERSVFQECDQQYKRAWDRALKIL